MCAATCKRCRRPVRWAALDGNSIPFDEVEAGVGAYEIYLAHGTYRARSHPGLGHPNVPAYRRHNCNRQGGQR